ncbi:MAG: BTAD domain-containing putative transcriptional regulator [Ilumatobacteraceae bacterium]
MLGGRLGTDVSGGHWLDLHVDRTSTQFVAAALGRRSWPSAATTEPRSRWLTALDADPWSERPYSSWPRATCTTATAAALQTLERCRAMSRELGLEPGPGVDQIERRIRLTGG